METTKFLKDIIRDKKVLYFSVIVSFLLGRLFDIFLPVTFKYVLDYSSEYVNTENIKIMDNVLLFSGLLIFVALASRISFRIFDFFEAKLIPAISAEIPMKVFTYISNHSVSFFENNFSGEIVQKIKQITDISKHFLIFFTTTVLSTLLTLIVTFILIVQKSPILAFSILIFGGFYFFISYFLSNKNKELASDWSNKNSIFNGNLIDSVENMILVKSSSKKEFELNKINEYAIQEKETLVHLKMNLTKIRLIHTIISSLLIIFVTFYSLYLYLHNSITLGDFVFNYTMITRLTGELYMIGETASDITEKFGIIKTALNFIYKKQSDDLIFPNINVEKGEITFNNVNFKYSDKSPYVFNNLNLKIRAKERVAFVGYSGSGKSTIVKIILKQYQNDSGEVYIDGQEISKFNSDSINNNITYINQNIYLFNRSIRENISYVKPDASEEQIVEAAKKAGCLDFILDKPNGFETLVGERGVQLSGGEKQRIGIARAFLSDKPILILDEPTSALDSISESIIQNSLKELMENKTVIIIAHRLSTIKNMDRLIVLKNGLIVEDGTHESLIRKNGIYQELWKNQIY